MSEKKLPIRSMYTAPPGKVLVSLDLSAAEAWVVAYLAEELNMQRELRAGDIHSFSACNIFDKPYDPLNPKAGISEDERFIGKKFNHAGNYRTGPFKIAEFVNKEGVITISVADAKRYHGKWLNTFNLHGWWGRVDEVLRTSRTITTAYGFKRKFWGIFNDDLKKEATAFEPQSTVADHMHGAICPELGIAGGNLEIFQRIVLPSRGEIVMCNTAHDSVMLEVPLPLVGSVIPECISYLRRPLVVRGEEFTIPVDAEWGERWKEMEKWAA